MRKALVVAARELRERWLFFPAGLVLGCVPLALPAFGVGRSDSTLVGLLTALVLGGTAALVSGATMLARDASARRLGFLFAQPLGWPAIWLGKWLAAAVLGGVTGLLAAVPWMTAYPTLDGRSWYSTWDAQGAILVLTWLLVAVGLSNLVATSFLSRSAWVAVDLAMVAVTTWGVRRYVPSLLCGAGAWGMTLLLAAPAVVLLLASAAQVAVGRTDLRRAHRALSLSFWAGILILLSGAALNLSWILAAGPGDLRTSWAYGADAGRRWVEVAGLGHRSSCVRLDLLIDVRSGGYLQLTSQSDVLGIRSGRPRSWELTFAERAELAARWTTGADGRSTALELFDLSGPAPRLSVRNLEGTAAPQWRTLLRLSPSGATALLVGNGGAASLFDTRSGQALATAVVPPGLFATDAVFSSQSGVRIWFSADDNQTPRRVLDLAPGSQPLWSDFALPVTWPGAGPGAAWALAPLREGERVLSFDEGVRLRDGRTGALIATLVEGGKSWGIGLLADGRIAVAVPRSGRTSLEVFDREGARLRGVDLGPAGPVTSVPEVAPDRVGVGVGPLAGAGQTVVVDIDQGRIVGRIDGLRPAATGQGAVPGVARSLGVGLFRDAKGRLVHLDSATGERRILTGPGAASGARISVR